ncbi:signal peptidase, endoplasmic reticulum-type [Lachnospiraceae bacterium RM5]|nr:signal peptidase, endoplasmic reticulum-type [Lachnospiraceae bacterium RM5]
MKKLLRIIVNILMWGLLIFGLLVTITVFSSERNNGISNLFGYMPMTVKTNSMSPTFKKGDLVIIKEVDDLYKLKKGDVITFYTMVNGTRIINTHRITEVNKEDNNISFTTKGDANDVEDSLAVSSGDVIGKWTNKSIPGFGKKLDFLQTKKGFFICILVPMAIFFLVELYKFIETLIEYKKPVISDEEEEEIKKKAVEEYLQGLGNKEADVADKDKDKEADIADAVDKAKDAVEKSANKAVGNAENTEKEIADVAESVEDKTEDVAKTVVETAEKTL